MLIAHYKETTSQVTEQAAASLERACQAILREIRLPPGTVPEIFSSPQCICQVRYIRAGLLKQLFFRGERPPKTVLVHQHEAPACRCQFPMNKLNIGFTREVKPLLGALFTVAAQVPRPGIRPDKALLQSGQESTSARRKNWPKSSTRSTRKARPH